MTAENAEDAWPVLAIDASSSALLHFLNGSVYALEEATTANGVPNGAPAHDAINLRFIFAAANGQVIRSDFLTRRLEGCEHVKHVQSFLAPLQHVTAVADLAAAVATTTSGAPNPSSTLNELLTSSIGAIRLSPKSSFSTLDAELKNRLSFSWLLPSPSASPATPALRRRRIAWIQGREDYESIGRAFEAALALGISLVIFDVRGHWLQADDWPYAHLREAFVELDITPDEGFPARIVEAVRAYPGKFDGMVTISDVRLPFIARACEILGLPTERPEAYDVAGDKGAARMLEEEGRGVTESFVLPDADGLEAVLSRQRTKEEGLQFPLIVKPVVGWCSDCVSKVKDEEQLVRAVRKASDRHAQSAKKSTAVVVEPYVDGPEVDANFALLDGEILFFEIVDDFPCTADDATRGTDANANFLETQVVMPSALPPAEITALRDQLHASILRQGFRSGIFHCEARIRNSRVSYQKLGSTSSSEGGLVDLLPRTDAKSTQDEPEVYLHEVNARTPGYLESLAVLLTYGVDYWALRMLLAIGPEEAPRLHALSQPFLNGPQFDLAISIITQNRAGIMRTPDAGKAFLEKHPHVKERTVDWYTLKKGGDILEGPDADELWWIAYFTVVSREGRGDLLQLVQYIHETFEYEVDEIPPQKP